MQGKDLTVYFLTIGGMIVLVVALGIVIFILRARLFGEQSGKKLDTGGVLETMRAMRDRGEIPDEEYRAARAALIAKAAARAPHAPSEDRTKPSPRSGRHAQPGFDLTGEPLPRPAPDTRDDTHNDPR